MKTQTKIQSMILKINQPRLKFELIFPKTKLTSSVWVFPKLVGNSNSCFKLESFESVHSPDDWNKNSAHWSNLAAISNMWINNRSEFRPSFQAVTTNGLISK